MSMKKSTKQATETTPAPGRTGSMSMKNSTEQATETTRRKAETAVSARKKYFRAAGSPQLAPQRNRAAGHSSRSLPG
ncbi:hypothetical protein [uncultured Rikenella sp.]|uniref:hypothetical protein n=1 Tax=uncultured Rikenella sp. TaxID=368003 RepID=UPI0026149B27|nr:hypothetical protein [uncultured Rikenella sp.]